MDITVPATQNATFLCVGHGYGFVDVRWLGVRTARSTVTTLVTSDNITSILTIFDVRGRDQRRYRCKYINNGGSRNSDQAHLTVESKY